MPRFFSRNFEGFSVAGRGRPATPNVVKLLRGNPGKRPINTLAPQPKTGAPTCPSWLSPRAKTEWRWIAPKLAEQRIITAIDRTLLAQYCESFASWQQAEKEIRKDGAVVPTGTGSVKASPWVHIRSQALAQMHRCLGELGMTPSSRSRLIQMPRAPGSTAASSDDPLGILG